jgi:hypothetical protein
MRRWVVGVWGALAGCSGMSQVWHVFPNPLLVDASHVNYLSDWT